MAASTFTSVLPVALVYASAAPVRDFPPVLPAGQFAPTTGQIWPRS